MPPLTPRNREIRSENVTASEVGALLGEHPYTDPAGIWDRLLNPFAPTEAPSEAMETGSFMEPAIAALAARRLDLRIRANSKTYVHPKVRLSATPDYLVIGQPPGLLEIKMSGRPEMWPYRGSMPAHVEWQVRAQMACARRYTAAVCVLVGVGLRTFLLERELDKEAEMLAAVDRFWRDHVVTRIRPGATSAWPSIPTFSFEADPAIREKEAVAP
jgi:putative phage-type endonuclease